jgi:hypothetical protein
VHASKRFPQLVDQLDTDGRKIVDEIERVLGPSRHRHRDSEGLDQLDLLVSERSYGSAVQDQNADEPPLEEVAHQEYVRNVVTYRAKSSMRSTERH